VTVPQKTEQDGGGVMRGYCRRERGPRRGRLVCIYRGSV
jgi:hypothetical protein